MRLFILLLLSASISISSRAQCPEHPGLKWLKTRSEYCQFQGEVAQIDPLTHQPAVIPFLYYYSRVAKTKSTPTVLVYPAMTGTIPIVEDLFSQKLVHRGYHAIVAKLVESVSDLNRPPLQINDFFIRSNWGSSALLDHLQSWPEIDANQMSAAGMSLGGIRATISYGEDRRLKHLIAYATGGNLPEIFAYSTVNFIKAYRKNWKEKLGLETDQAFAQYLKTILTQDPLLTAQKRKLGRDAFFVLGKTDISVPYRYQLELLHALGDPPHRTTNQGHWITTASFLTHFDDVIRVLANSPAGG